MRITNKYGFPDALVRAVESDPYDRGLSDFTVTELIDSPRIAQLLREHDHEIEEDVSDRIWALLGQAVHTILERAETEARVEERLYAKVGGVTIGGQFDRLALEENGILQDYKVTSVWSVIYGKDSWAQQLNINRFLAEQNGLKVRRLEIVAILRDWQKREAQRNRDYPDHQVVRIPIVTWPKKKLDTYLKSRIKVHQDAAKNLPLCTDEERWARPTKFAVMKRGLKKASRLCDTEEEAKKAAKFIPGAYVQVRPGEYPRCQDYCAVAQFCSQWKATPK